MITEQDLQEAIAECEGQRNPNANTCLKLAAFYTIRNEMFSNANKSTESQDFGSEIFTGHSGYSNSEIIEYDSGTEFSKEVSGKDFYDIIPLMDELMEILRISNPRLYNGFMRKLRS